jgi:hypothetical protein
LRLSWLHFEDKRRMRNPRCVPMRRPGRIWKAPPLPAAVRRAHGASGPCGPRGQCRCPEASWAQATHETSSLRSKTHLFRHCARRAALRIA